MPGREYFPQLGHCVGLPRFSTLQLHPLLCKCNFLQVLCQSVDNTRNY